MRTVSIIAVSFYLAGCSGLPKSLEEIEEVRNSPEWEEKKDEWKAEWDEKRKELEEDLAKLRAFLDAIR